MNPLNVGILEILVILALALVLFGPSKLISVVTSLRGALQEFQRAAQGMASSAVDEVKAEAESNGEQPVEFRSEEAEEQSPMPRAKARSAEPHERSGPVE